MDNKLVTILLDSDILFDLSCHNYTLAEAALEIAKLLTPKLQWKSEEITCYGGTVLLSRTHSVVNCDADIQIFDPGDIFPYVTWNGKHVFEGELEECKQFCSDKILNDFLKLCE